jgi:dTDP-4-dehydrorhamnose 3,5-epimerase
MPFSFRPTLIPEVILIEPRIFPDQRGFFTETYKHSEFAAQGITEIFVQCNMSRSSKGILRGLHYQKYPKCQSKLVWSVAGEIYDVVVDLRRSSPTFGKWIAQMLSAENRKILYVPAGFAHGFCVTSEVAEIVYMATQEYAPAFEAGVLWNDPTLQIDWPIPEPQLSDRDKSWPRLADTDRHVG